MQYANRATRQDDFDREETLLASCSVRDILRAQGQAHLLDIPHGAQAPAPVRAPAKQVPAKQVPAAPAGSARIQGPPAFGAAAPATHTRFCDVTHRPVAAPSFLARLMGR